MRDTSPNAICDAITDHHPTNAITDAASSDTITVDGALRMLWCNKRWLRWSSV